MKVEYHYNISWGAIFLLIIILAAIFGGPVIL